MKRLLIITLLITLLMSVPSCGEKQASAGTDAGAASQKQTVKLTKTKLSMTAGTSRTIKLKGAKASKVKWSSSKKSVATVSKGKIKARKAGKATITAKYKNRKYRCRVTVRNKKEEPVIDPEQPADDPADPSQDPEQPADNTEEPGQPAEGTDTPAEEQKLKMMLGSTEVEVEWLDNDSVAALKELVKDKPLTIQMSMYGGFEQVGSLGTRLPRNDKETTTSAGDIVLYSGNQIVVFYGSNSWAYTRLGHITNKTKAELKELLGSGDITLTISM